jgi:hypothetical protein
MPKTTPEQNKTLVLEAFDTLFNKRDYAAAEKFWSPQYIQHSAFSPTIPVSAAGPRTEIATSLPMPIGESPAAIAADSPPLEPPGVRSTFHGFLVRPVTRLSVSCQAENSGRFVFASGIAPAALKCVTTVASFSGMFPEKILDPRCVSTPAVSMLSLIVNGTP